MPGTRARPIGPRRRPSPRLRAPGSRPPSLGPGIGLVCGRRRTPTRASGGRRARGARIDASSWRARTGSVSPPVGRRRSGRTCSSRRRASRSRRWHSGCSARSIAGRPRRRARASRPGASRPFEAEGLDIGARVRHDIAHDGWIARNAGCRRLSWARADPIEAPSGARRPQDRGHVDAVLYGVSALFAGLTAAAAQIPLQRMWGDAAFWAYAGAALIAALAAWTSRRSTGDGARHLRRRTILVLAVFVAAATRTDGGRSRTAHRPPGCTRTVGGGSSSRRRPPQPWRVIILYAVEYRDGPLSARPEATQIHFPYLPAMLLFGMPRALAGNAPWTDARVWFTSSRSSPRASASSGCRPSELRGSGSSRCSSPFPPGHSSSRREGSTSR